MAREKLPDQQVQPEKTAKVGWTPLFVALTIVIVLWLTNWFFVYKYCLPTDRAIFGDSFGSVNALFAGLAFAVLIFTIYLQREELQLQRKELELTRQELHGQKDQMQQQNETLLLQKFENTFFQLLSLLNEIIKDMKVPGDRSIEGRACFAAIYVKLGAEYKAGVAKNQYLDSIDSAVRVYEHMYESYENELGHYFRTLYHIYKYIDQSFVSYPNKHRYANFARAQLSDRELALLFYNCLSKNGIDKFKPLIERYQILKNMDLSGLLNINHKKAYTLSAFNKPE